MGLDNKKGKLLGRDRDELINLADKALKREGVISVIVVLLGFLLGTLLIAFVGKNPSGMYSSIWQAITGHNTVTGRFNIRNIGDTLNYLVPFTLCGLSIAFAYRAGLFNIGAEGQYIVGMTVATVCAYYGPKVPVIHAVYCLLMATAAAAAYGGVVGYLKSKFEVSEVVATIMLNYTALYLSRMVCMALPGATTYNTSPFPKTALMKWGPLESMFNGSTINLGILVLVFGLLVYWFIMEKTILGFELKATGFNKNASLASGIPTRRSTILSMAISGAFAGAAGAVVAIGSFTYGRIVSGMDNYGFNGIAVALIGNCKTIGILLAGYLFGVLKQAQQFMQTRGVPREVTFIIQGVIVVFIALRSAAEIMRARISKMKVGDSKAKSGAPASVKAE